ncbi:DUF1349 domain-containing protein, partial [Thermodesulfobacteriota bacterium]
MKTCFFLRQGKAWLFILFFSLAFIHPTLTQAVDGPLVDVWYGPEQAFGEIGLPQRWINILGNVSDPDGISSLSYSLNGGPSLPLSIGPDGRRLAEDGDFNVEIDSAELLDGPNQLVITATDTLDNVTVENITINFATDSLWPMSYSAKNWSAVGNIQDAGQVVDGLWTLETGSVRPVQMGYDRLVALGDIQWTDYEVTVPITIHGIDMAGFSKNSVAPAVGIVMRWQGHEAWDDSQPRWGYYPVGANAVYEFDGDETGSLSLKGEGWSSGDPAARTLAYEVKYFWKMRVQTLPLRGSLFSLKLWEDGQPEPEEWEITALDEEDLPAGCMLLSAHHVDANFGDVTVVPLQDSDVHVAHGETEATITWATDVPATSRVDYGLTDSYELTIEDVTLVTQHSIPLNGLTAGLIYHYRVSCVSDEGFAGSRTGQFRAGALSGIGSDDFHLPDLDTDLWEFINPLGDVVLTMTGTQAQIEVPDPYSSHDAWTSTNTLPRLLQDVNDADFEVEAKFESLITQNATMQGIMVEQDSSNFLRIEFNSSFGDYRVFAAGIFGGSAQIYTMNPMFTDEPMYLRVRREGNLWTVLYSYDGVSWTLANTFTQAMTVTAVGVYTGNPSGTPQTALVDYFFNTASPIDPEDGGEEICGNGLDDDGDGIIDNRDIDEDGYIDEACGGPDCDDTDPEVNPDGIEVCDGIDNNCSDGVDEEPFASDYCDNGLFCDGGEYCSAGSCQAGTPPNCNDNNECTDDSCDPVLGCVYADNMDFCDDGDACTTLDVCSEGECVGGSPLDCDDGNECTDNT